MPTPEALSQAAEVERTLHAKGFPHLRVRVHGPHLIIYTQDEDGPWNRARLTSLPGGHYQLGMADRRGRWEPTPFEGTLNEVLPTLLSDFAFALAPS